MRSNSKTNDRRGIPQNDDVDYMRYSAILGKR